MEKGMMDVMNAAAAAAAVCVLCQRAVNVTSTKAGRPLHFPFSTSLPLLLLSILTWSMISAILLRRPVSCHGTR